MVFKIIAAFCSTIIEHTPIYTAKARMRNFLYTLSNFIFAVVS